MYYSLNADLGEVQRKRSIINNTFPVQKPPNCRAVPEFTISPIRKFPECRTVPKSAENATSVESWESQLPLQPKLPKSYVFLRFLGQFCNGDIENRDSFTLWWLLVLEHCWIAELSLKSLLPQLRKHQIAELSQKTQKTQLSWSLGCPNTPPAKTSRKLRFLRFLGQFCNVVHSELGK